MSQNIEPTQIYDYDERTQIQTLHYKSKIAEISQRLINIFNQDKIYKELYDITYADSDITYDSFLECLLLENAKNMIKSTSLFHDEKNDTLSVDCKKIIDELDVLIRKVV